MDAFVFLLRAGVWSKSVRLDSSDIGHHFCSTGSVRHAGKCVNRWLTRSRGGLLCAKGLTHNSERVFLWTTASLQKLFLRKWQVVLNLAKKYKITIKGSLETLWKQIKTRSKWDVNSCCLWPEGAANQIDLNCVFFFYLFANKIRLTALNCCH